MSMLSTEQRQDFLRRGFSRRHFGRIATMLTAGATLPFYNEPALAQMSQKAGPIPPGAIRLNNNENPMGPCSEAADAIHNIVARGGRYMYEQTNEFVEQLASMEGVPAKYVRAFSGSSAPLHQAVLAFCSPQKSYVISEPTYEAGSEAAKFIGAKVVGLPLRKDYAHDVKGMASADPNAGLLYVCNPNNPTGTLTSRQDIEWLLANKPAGSVLMVDEAYLHIAEAATPCTDLVAQDKDIIVLRTFSKIYGMAGLRLGAAFARSDLLQKIVSYGAFAVPTTAVAGGMASLKVKTLVPQRRKIIGDIREDTVAFLEKHSYGVVPSVSNKFMVDVKRPGQEVIDGLKKENIYIGRLFPAMPTHVRVTVGTREEMEKFKAAFLKVMA
ncbi:MAG: pyridoxal phosphate-dependent aminotransferase [Acidobacteriia bacterium]|nr:pyridoxal phosphate-dependent aminotransferase [Terriglobia bacterium]